MKCNKLKHQELQNIHKSGFTLSEVLITLGVIGIIAAITIPILVADYQKKQTVSQLQKAYSEINQVFNLSINDNGDPKTWDWSSGGTIGVATTRVAETYFVPYFSIAQNCGYVASSACSKAARKVFSKSANYPFNNNLYHIILNDGTYLGFNFNTFPSPNYFMFLVDVNAENPPNVLGKDAFLIYIDISTGKLGFYGRGSSRNTLINDATRGCSTSATSWGGGFCGALIQQDGWTISDDYQW